MSTSSRPFLTADSISCVLPDGRRLFDSFSLGITAGERLALVGANGSGKSTALSILARRRPPTTGYVSHWGRVSYVPQAAWLAMDNSVAAALGVQSILDALARIERGESTPAQLADDLELVDGQWTLPDRMQRVLSEVRLEQVRLDDAVSCLSGGQRARLHLAAQLLQEPDVLLLDEPTNDLDALSRDTVCNVVSDWRGGVVVASHDRVLLNRVERILELRQQSVRSYGGNYANYREAVEAERASTEAALESATAALKKTRDALIVARERKLKSDAKGRRSRDTGSQPSLVLNGARERSQHTGAKLQDAAQRLERAARERVAEAAQHVEQRKAMKIPVAPSGLPAGTTVVSLHDVTLAHTQDAPIVVGVSFDVVGSERVALVGENGSGKSTILASLVGSLPPVAGTLYRGVPLARVALLDQHVALLGHGHSLLSAFRAHHPVWEDSAIRDTLARFHFREDTVLRPVESLSGGERMRLALAIALSGTEPVRCLLLDEPTNHLDLESVEQLESALHQFDGAIVVASHDAQFLEAIGCTRRLDVAQWRPSASG